MQRHYRLTEFIQLVYQHREEIRNLQAASGRLQHIDLAEIFILSPSELARQFTFVFGGVPTTHYAQYRTAIDKMRTRNAMAADELAARSEYPCIDIQNSLHLLNRKSHRNPRRAGNYSDYGDFVGFWFIEGRANVNIDIDWQKLEELVQARGDLCLPELRQRGDLRVQKQTLAAAVSEHELREAEETLSREGAFDPASIEDAREWAAKLAVLRKGQARFREKLMESYERACAITRCRVAEALEAAHIVSYHGDKTNHPANGILLRADVHTLFDAGLISIGAEGYISVSELLKGSEYERYHGDRMFLPRVAHLRPCVDALRMKALDTRKL